MFEVNNAGILTQEAERAEKSGTERNRVELSVADLCFVSEHIDI